MSNLRRTLLSVLLSWSILLLSVNIAELHTALTVIVYIYYIGLSSLLIALGFITTITSCIASNKIDNLSSETKDQIAEASNFATGITLTAWLLTSVLHITMFYLMGWNLLLCFYLFMLLPWFVGMLLLRKIKKEIFWHKLQHGNEMGESDGMEANSAGP